MELDIQKLKGQDHQAFEDFVRSYEKKVYNIALRMVKDQSLAYDISQEVFIKVYSSLPGFKANSSLSTWIYRITVNLCIDYQRKSKRESTTSLIQSGSDGEDFSLEIADNSSSPETCYEKQEMMERIFSALSELSADHRAVVLLRDIEHKSYREITEILNCGEGTVKSRLSRAREQLRGILNRSGNFFSQYLSK